MLSIQKLALLFIVFSIIPVISGCDKDEVPDDPDGIPNGNLVIYSNESGVPNNDANALQARYTDESTNDMVDFYGNFDSEGRPNVIRTVRVNRSDNDTIINFLIDPVTNNFDKAIFEVNGERLETMVTFDFPLTGNSMVMSFYNVDWSSGSTELVYSGEFSAGGDNLNENPIYQPRLAEIQDGGFLGLLTGIGTGIAVAETGVALGFVSGGSLATAAAGTVAAGVAAVGSTVIIGVVVVGAALFAISDANAGELEPQPNYPPNTPVQNPTPDPEPTLEPLENPCLENRVEVFAEVNQNDDITAIANGGTGGPYTFNWSTGASESNIAFSTITPPSAGTYTVSAIDENGCAAAASATIYDGINLSGYWIMEIGAPCHFGTLDGDAALLGFGFGGNSVSFDTITVIIDGYQEDGSALNSGQTTNSYTLDGNDLNLELGYEFTDTDSCQGQSYESLHTVSVNISATYNENSNQFTGTITDVGDFTNQHPCETDFPYDCNSSVTIYRP